MGKGAGKGRGEGDDSSGEEMPADPAWPKIVAAVLGGLFVLQIIVIGIVATGDDPVEAPPPTPAPAPPAFDPTATTQTENPDAVAPPPPAPAPAPGAPQTLDRRMRVNQFETAITHESQLDDLLYLTTPTFESTFGAGCSIVGGGVYCGEGTVDLDGLKQIVRDSLHGASDTNLQHIYGQSGDPCVAAADGAACTTSGTVTDHYTVGATGAHGAIIYHFQGMMIDEIFWYADAGEHVRVLQDYYNVVDTCGSESATGVACLSRLDQYINGNYLAVFGPGTAKVGGATHQSTDNDLMDKEAFKAFVVTAPRRCNPDTGCLANMERSFIVQGDTVVNHYISRGTNGEIVHAVAVHEFVEGKIAESYWYSEHTSSNCAPPQHEQIVRNFLERIDAHYLPTVDDRYISTADLNLDEFTHVDYSAVFGPGCVLIGRNQRCGPDEVLLTKAELEDFISGTGKLFPGGNMFLANCEHDLLTMVANNASVPHCTRAWSNDPNAELDNDPSTSYIAAMASCTSVHFQAYTDVCVDNQIMAEGDSVVDTYEYRCGVGAAAERCTIDSFLPRGVVVHEFDGSEIATSYWYNPS